MYKMELCKNSFFLTQQVMNLFKITTIAMYAGMAVMTREGAGLLCYYKAQLLAQDWGHVTQCEGHSNRLR